MTTNTSHEGCQTIVTQASEKKHTTEFKMLSVVKKENLDARKKFRQLYKKIKIFVYRCIIGIIFFANQD